MKKLVQWFPSPGPSKRTEHGDIEKTKKGKLKKGKKKRKEREGGITCSKVSRGHTDTLCIHTERRIKSRTCVSL